MSLRKKECAASQCCELSWADKKTSLLRVSSSQQTRLSLTWAGLLCQGSDSSPLLQQCQITQHGKFLIYWKQKSCCEFYLLWIILVLSLCMGLGHQKELNIRTAANETHRVWEKYTDRGRTRTCNPQIRSLVPYPLGHTTQPRWIVQREHKMCVNWQDTLQDIDFW